MHLTLPISFRGQTVTVVGGGASLKGFNFDKLKPPIIAVNDAVFYVDTKFLVAIDSGWHRRYDDWLDGFDGYLITHNGTHREEAYVIELDEKGSWLDYTMKSASLSGFTALAVAFYMGAEKVFLLGYDGGFVNGESSNFYENRCVNIGSKSYEKKNRHFEFFQRHPVVNVGENSLIPYFKKVPLDCDFYNMQ